MLRLALFCALGAVGLAGCKKKEPAPAVEPPPPPPPQAQSRVDNGLLGELAREAAQRTKVEPTVETTIASFEMVGVHIARRQQVLATPVGALYCTAAISKVGLNLSLCEYATPELAKTGREKSKQVFKALKGRTLVVVNRTVLTLMPATTPAVKTERDRAEKTFRALDPRLSEK